MSSGILPSFLGAVQASLAVLLTIGYGAIASRFNLLKESSSRDISKTCVRLFLPALLITNVGSELRPENVLRYVPVLSKPCFHVPYNQALIPNSMGVGIYSHIHGSGMGSQEGIQIPSLDCARNLLQQYHSTAPPLDSIS